MDRDIFDELDQLGRGALGSGAQRSQTRRPQYDASPAYTPYNGHVQDQGHPLQHEYGVAEQYHDEPHRLDGFDEQLLQEPDYNSRHGQAELGNARLSLRTAGTPRYSQIPRAAPLHQAAPAPRRLDLSQFALGSGQPGPSTSPIRAQQLPSSPSFGASQRRTAGYDTAPETPRHIAYHQPQRRISVSRLQGEQLSQMQAPTITDIAEEFPLSEPSYDQTVTARVPSRPAAGKTPVVQGISLVATHELPDRFRSIFNFPLFNAIQSKSFEAIYKTNNNFVLSSPTGSGKTAILELAICRLINGFGNGSFKIVYQAPTKSLCAERQRDWQAKFGPLDLQCAELTGDTDHAQLRHVHHASIIITTPEKWDSMTRKWKDHQKLMQMVKLFLIDEVHILKEYRGATLEAVVSRMKSIGSDVRFVALSATVPNSQDISTWLGKDPMHPQLPAIREHFGEEFRPVRLQKHVCGYNANTNDFAFDKVLNTKLPEVISKWSQKKSLMVFCFTRAACVDTAKVLSNWWAIKSPIERYWSAPRKTIRVVDKDLRDTVTSGVAFHHAGLTMDDRNAVEKGYLEGDINVICCTSTLAVGVNLPCHMVLIKNTVTFAGSACKEYSDLEVMQMLGRAGRPQFDDSAVAIIMTRLEKVNRYEKMMNGQEVLESCLHRNLIDHLNAEIGLGTIINASSAKKWLAGTFLYVRLKEHPEHYHIAGDAPGSNLEDRLDNICNRAIDLLSGHNLVKPLEAKLQCTEFGNSMARYYIQFETMKIFLSLPRRAKISEILSAISQAAEFRDVRFRTGEKPIYKDLNKNGFIKFPIPVNLDLPAQKVSLVIQSILGGVDLPSEEPKHRNEYLTAKSTIFQHLHRLIRCIIDCQLHLEDATATRNALMLARSFGAQVWDDSPLHMKQLEGLGVALVRKIAFAGVKSIEELENIEASAVERACSRNPPFGSQIQAKAKAFPKLRVGVKVVGEPIVKRGEHVAIRIKAEIAFLNEKMPEMFHRKTVYVVMLAETSDGRLVHFARISAKKLNKGQDVLFTANLTSASQSVGCYVMCDEIAGTLRHAVLKHNVPPSAFPPPKTVAETKRLQEATKNTPNSSKRRISTVASNDTNNEFGDAGLADDDLAAVGEDGFVDIDQIDATDIVFQPVKKQKTSRTNKTSAPFDWQPRQLANGRWACNHTCGDTKKCNHKCCEIGLEKKPRPPKQKSSKKSEDSKSTHTQTQLDMSASKPLAETAYADLTSDNSPPHSTGPTRKKKPDPPQMQQLNRLHGSTERPGTTVLSIGKLKPIKKKPANAPLAQGQHHLSFLSQPVKSTEEAASDSTDYGDFDSTDLPDIGELLGNKPLHPPSSSPVRKSVYDLDDDNDGMLNHPPLNSRPATKPHSEEPGGRDINNTDLADYAAHYWPDFDYEQPRNPTMGVQTASAAPETGMRRPFTHAGSCVTSPDEEEGEVDIALSVPAGSVEEAFDRVFLAGGNFPAGQEEGELGKQKAASGDAGGTDELADWFYREFGCEDFELVD